jgi:hypothetical protein
MSRGIDYAFPWSHVLNGRYYGSLHRFSQHSNKQQHVVFSITFAVNAGWNRFRRHLFACAQRLGLMVLSVLNGLVLVALQQFKLRIIMVVLHLNRFVHLDMLQSFARIQTDSLEADLSLWRTNNICKWRCCEKCNMQFHGL